MIHIIGLWLNIHSVTDLKLGVVSCKSVFISANLEKNESFGANDLLPHGFHQF